MVLFFLIHFLKTILFINLLLDVLGLPCCVGFSLVAESESYSLVEVVCGLLIAVTSLVEHRDTWASVVAASRL